jgi:hypothetical protein
MTRAVPRDPIYRQRRFSSEIIETCVGWYITYRLSYRDLAAMMAERGIVEVNNLPNTTKSGDFRLHEIVDAEPVSRRRAAGCAHFARKSRP